MPPREGDSFVEGLKFGALTLAGGHLFLFGVLVMAPQAPDLRPGSFDMGVLMVGVVFLGLLPWMATAALAIQFHREGLAWMSRGAALPAVAELVAVTVLAILSTR